MVIGSLIVSVLLLVVGYIIRRGGAGMWLISEYRENRIEDEKGMARWVGTMAYVVAGAFVLSALLWYTLPENPVLVAVGSYFIILNLVVIWLAGSQRFMRKNYGKKDGQFGRRG